MNWKPIAYLGFALLILAHLLLLYAGNFLAGLSFDLAHWLLLMGGLFASAFLFIFPKGIISTIASMLTILGLVAIIGMAGMDMLLFSFGDNFEERDALLSHMRNSPSIWLPFFTIGPAFFYAGLATFSWNYIRSKPLFAILTIIGSLGMGFGQMISGNAAFILGGLILMGIGLVGMTRGKYEV
ncbi:MAG: hypothetical protein KDC24_14980 [Saprospiraceae bacterium]|nr:hypothetical protein [Saprospiraceae bacterium]